MEQNGDFCEIGHKILKLRFLRFKLNDEWIAMDSSRLRIPVPILFKEGDRCLARWTDSRKFPAVVLEALENSKNLLNFSEFSTNILTIISSVFQTNIKFFSTMVV